jgi:hypothetical protein
MAVTVNWVNPQRTLIKYDFSGRWTWGELYTALLRGRYLQDSVDHTVYMIFDMRSSAEIPDNAISQVRRFIQYVGNNSGLHVVIADNIVAKFFTNLFLRFYPGGLNRRYRMATSIDEALLLINDEILRVAA